MTTPFDPGKPSGWRPRQGDLARALRRLTRGVGRAAAVFARDTSGAITILTALLSMVLIGFTGLAVDVGDLYTTKRSMQNAADAAAVHATIELLALGSSDAVVIDAARQMATENGFDPNNGAQVDVTIIDGQSVQVAISEPSPRLFAGLFVGGTVNISAVATGSAVAGDPVCLLSLQASGAKRLELKSNSGIDAPDCSIQVNSTHWKAASITSNASVTALSICVTGGYEDQSTGGYSPTPETGSTDCPPVPDPLAALAPPPYSGCDFDDLELDDVTTTLSAGVYCNDLTIKGVSDVTFLPGVYIIKGGDFEVENESIVFGEGVGFYLVDGATIDFDDNASVDFKAPTDGDLAGILFFQARGENDENEFNSDNINRLEGTIYFPDGTFESGDSATVGANSAFTILIARRIKLDSNARLVLNADYAASDVPFVRPTSGGVVAGLSN